MDVIEALDKLGFSFWQPIVFLGLWFFRSDLSKLIGKVKSIKVKDAEMLILEGESNIRNTEVHTLENMKKSYVKAGEKVPENMHKILEKQLENKYIGSLIHIRSSTTFVWGALKELKTNDDSSALIRNETLTQIADDLSILSQKEFFSLELKEESNELYEVTFKKTNRFEILIPLLDKAEDY